MLYALAAFGIWGVNPLYFDAVRQLPPLELLAHRIVWSVPLTALLITAVADWSALRAAVADRRTLATLAISSLLVSLNWLTFIYAIATQRVVEASLGYFINPLVNVLLGLLFLRESLSRPQAVAVFLALGGTLELTWSHGRLPWIALVLALSFGLYGLLRKTVAIEAVNGLFVETLLLSPLALGYLAALAGGSRGTFGTRGIRLDLLIVCAGVVTAVPLVLYTSASRRLRYITIGVLQYLAPSIQLTLGVFWFGEPFTRAHSVAFGLIWSGLVLFVVDAARTARATTRPTSRTTPTRR